MKTVKWKIEAKSSTGEPIAQKTLITHKSQDERVLEFLVPGKDEFTKFMQIEFVRCRPIGSTSIRCDNGGLTRF